jgi:anti-sigma-K factor RskA
MNWYHHPTAVDQLASAYVLGTLQGRARRRFEAVMHSQPQGAGLAEAVERWTQRLSPMLTSLPPMQPSAALWSRIAQRAGVTNQPKPSASWWQRWFAPVPAGALAMGLMLGYLAPVLLSQQQDTLLPESYVGVLATPQGKHGLIVSSLRQGKVVEIKQVTPTEVAPGSTLYLWRIDQAGVVSPIGPLANDKFVRMVLPEPAEKVFFTAVELAVSVEPMDTRPSAPTQTFVYRGLCGKLWKPKAN